MKKYIFFAFVILGLGSSANAQQDAMFTKYMFNPLPFNPAVTGTTGALDMILMHRHQWFGIQGAPLTQSFSIHSPIKIGKVNDNASVGGFLAHDQVGVTRTFTGYATFSYRLRLNNPKNSNKIIYLNIGLSAGLANWSANYTTLDLDDSNDPSFQNLTPNLLLPNFGAGFYLYSKMWYVGLSAPKLWTNNMRTRLQSENSSLPIAQEYRHYYLTFGGAIKITDDFVIRPSFLLKNVGLFVSKNNQNTVAAPTQFNVDLGFMLMRRFWVGVSFRSSIEAISGLGSSYDSIDFWLGMRLKNGIRFGLSYDYTLTKIQGPGLGSYEVILGYDLFKTKEDIDGGRVIDPRYLSF
ncbi:type IX secretion system membrane protein PorP/SprF [Aureispira]|nr:type IX secretion system membrane protein PorP/SprF [Aureispira sp.]